ncbi:MAG: type VI secretion IcmF C-terminal domain-containing protein, partial [Gammaproteobacteria bacterium]
QEARNYLNVSWKKDVITFYNERMAHRYPLVKTAKKEISPAEFAEFFGINGRLNTYFETHLKPFVDTSVPRWRWRSNPLKIPDELLLQFQRAAMIRKMYFNTNQKLDVAVQIQPGNLMLKWPADTAQLGPLSASGPWALFRLIDKGQLQHLSGPHHFEWRTTINGQPMRYELSTAQAINPLIAGIVDTFELPEQL